ALVAPRVPAVAGTPVPAAARFRAAQSLDAREDGRAVLASLLALADHPELVLVELGEKRDDLANLQLVVVGDREDALAVATGGDFDLFLFLSLDLGGRPAPAAPGWDDGDARRLFLFQSPEPLGTGSRCSSALGPAAHDGERQHDAGGHAAADRHVDEPQARIEQADAERHRSCQHEQEAHEDHDVTIPWVEDQAPES